VDSELLTAIGAALGQDGPYQAMPPARGGGYSLNTGLMTATGAGNQVLAGTMDPGRGLVGWVEEVAGTAPEGYMRARITINVGGPGHPHLRVPIETYNAYFGCDVHWMAFCGRALITVYTEKHRTLATCLVPPSAQLRLISVRHPLTLSDDYFCHTQRKHSLVGVVALRSFEPCVPFPAPPGVRDVSLDVTPGPDGPVLRWAEQFRVDAPANVPQYQRGWRDGRVLRWRLPTASQAGFPASPAEVWDRLRAALDGPGVPPGGPDILIGAVAAPFWHAPTLVTEYHTLRGVEEPPPWWFPVAWHNFLRASPDRASEAGQWLAWLDRLAASGPDGDGAGDAAGWQRGWSRAEGAAHLALRQIQMSAGPLADACRPGRPPASRAWKAGDWAYQVPLEGFPAGFFSAWTGLPAEFLPGPPY
jgi:hypothetical protein